MVVEVQIQQIVDRACALTSCNNVCLAGGVALNCVSNGLLTEKYPERSFYIQPAAGDAGGALGAALALHAMHFGNTVCGEAMANAFLGPHFPIKPLGDLLSGRNIAIVTLKTTS